MIFSLYDRRDFWIYISSKKKISKQDFSYRSSLHASKYRTFHDFLSPCSTHRTFFSLRTYLRGKSLFACLWKNSISLSHSFFKYLSTFTFYQITECSRLVSPLSKNIGNLEFSLFSQTWTRIFRCRICISNTVS